MSNKEVNVLIAGAGEAGEYAVNQIKRNRRLSNYNIIGFVDDDLDKSNQKVSNLEVLGLIKSLPTLIQSHKIDLIIIAMPSAEGQVVRNILDICSEVSIDYRIISGIYDLLTGEAKESKIKSIEPYDLIKRRSSAIQSKKIDSFISGQDILVTGGAGSIGSEICRQLSNLAPNKLFILDHEESNLFNIDHELRSNFPKINLIPIICDIRDFKKLNSIFEDINPDIVFHAAAYKHVPLMEMYPDEAVKTNVLGTYNILKCSTRKSVNKFILISTDKAVNPKSIMGATKAIAELLVREFSKKINCFSVRFGNVWGSRGSVVPLFQEQIKLGGPVTVTHPEMIRYFMTIEEASQLVIKAGSIGKEGEVYMLDMGEPIKIMDIAEYLIRSQGLIVNKDIKIVTTSIRPGEKLEETLINKSEILQKTNYKQVFKSKVIDNNFQIIDYVKKLEESLDNIANLNLIINKIINLKNE